MEKFKARKSLKSVTKKCEAGDRIFDDKRLLVVDAPGFFDTELGPKVLIPEIAGSYQVAAPGPHVFLVVFSFDRFTPQEEAVAKWISEVFDERAFDYCIIVFTGLDGLIREKQDVEEFLKDAPEFFLNFLEKCNRRYIAVDNTKTNEHDKEETLIILLHKISTMIKKNGGQYYNNKHFIEIANVLEKYPGWYDPVKPDGTVNVVKETHDIIIADLKNKTVIMNH
jgi:hypothetical protein